MAADDPNRPPITRVGFAMVGSEMVGFTIVGVLIDWLAGTMPWATVGLTLLGLVVAMLHLARLVQRRPPNDPGRP